MSSPAYARVREIFLKSVELSDNERTSYLRAACGEDETLYEELQTLLAHHRSETILADGPSGPTTVSPSDNGAGATPAIVRGFSSVAHLLMTRPSRRAAVAAIAIAALLALGAWTHYHVRQGTRRIVGDQLQAVVNSQNRALQGWIEQCREESQAWAAHAQLRQHVQRLIQREISAPGASKQLADAEEQTQIRQLTAPFLDEQGNTGLSICDRNGVIVFSSQKDAVGRRLDATAMGRLSRVFEGETRFLGPHTATDWSVQSKSPDEQAGAAEGIGRSEDRAARPRTDPQTWIATPIRDDQQAVIGVLGMSRNAMDFSNILSVAWIAGTGETYAFDANGRMLTESRYPEQLKQIGLLSPTESRSMLSVQIRNPGVNMLRGGQPPSTLAARPLTELAARAVSAGDPNHQDPDDQHGVIIRAYRDYRGVPVIGAYRWLPEYEFGIASEISVAEADGPLVYIEIAFAALLVCLSLVAAVAWVATSSTAALRSQVSLLSQAGDYRLIRQIGEGGMARVYLARHTLLRRPAAVKVLKPESISHEMVARFEREVQLASLLTHPNTIEIYDFGRTTEGAFYCAMEYVAGPNLSRLVALDGPVPVERVVHILRQVCGSLSEAHGMGLVHRDIKPENIALCRRGGEYDVVKVLDFGLAKTLDTAETVQITGELQVIGTPVYMAPERFEAPDRLDARSDIYAVGAVAYYLLRGKPIFGGSSSWEILGNVLNAEPPAFPPDCEQQIPASLQQIVMRCLAKHADDRPQTIADLLDSLASVPLNEKWDQQRASLWWAAYIEGGRAEIASPPT